MFRVFINTGVEITNFQMSDKMSGTDAYLPDILKSIRHHVWVHKLKRPQLVYELKYVLWQLLACINIAYAKLAPIV